MAVSVLACSNQKAAESPLPEGPTATDAGAATAATPPAPVTSDAPVVETLFVRGPLAACQGEEPRQCLLVRGSHSEPWRNLYAPIEGFDHDPAFDYELRVEVSKVERPPADASSLRYHLLEVISKQPTSAP